MEGDINTASLSPCPCADADHHFTIRACDWGFREFVPLSELRDPRCGFSVDEKVMISAKVKVVTRIASVTRLEFYIGQRMTKKLDRA